MAIQVSAGRGVRVDTALFDKHIGMYAAVTGKSLGLIIKDQTRLLCKDLCDFYPPFSGSSPSITVGGEGGFGNKARDKGRDAVSRDVRKIFAPLAQAPASAVASYGNLAAFSAWMNEKVKLPSPHLPEYIFKTYARNGNMVTQEDFNRFKEIEAQKGKGSAKFFTSVSDGQIKSEHEKRRGSPNYRVKKSSKSETIFVDNFSSVETYIKKVQQRVGKLKAGWYHAGLKLGRMPTSAWIAGQGSQNSVCKPMLDNLKPKITIGNNIARRYSGGWHFFAKARDHRAFAMRNQMIHHLKGEKNHGKLLEVVRKLGSFQITNT